MKIFYHPYVTKSDIQSLMKTRWEKVNQVFAACKALENDSMNLRPNKVPSQLVFKVLGINYNFALRQYKESLEAKCSPNRSGVKIWTVKSLEKS